MTSQSPTRNSIPSIVNTLNPLVRRLLGMGMPMGQNVLLTVRGRTSGQLRKFPVTILESGGHEYVFAAFGETNWVQNLRAAAGEAILKRGRREKHVLAVELALEEAARVLQAGFVPVFKVKGFGSMIGGWYGLTKDSTPADYLEAARQHAGFELRPAR